MRLIGGSTRRSAQSTKNRTIKIPSIHDHKTVTNITPLNQKQLASGLVHLKRTYKDMLKFHSKIHDEIHHHRRQIKLTSTNPFYNHRREIWQARVEKLESLLTEGRPLKYQIQEALANWIRTFDQMGPASVHVYAALLSTHHVHVERALAEGAKNLMELIIYQVEDGASKADWVGDAGVLHGAVTEVALRAMLHNEELQQFAHEKLQEMMVEKTGRPLREYQVTTLPNGQTVLKSMPPMLKVVYSE